MRELGDALEKLALGAGHKHLTMKHTLEQGGTRTWTQRWGVVPNPVAACEEMKGLESSYSTSDQDRHKERTYCHGHMDRYSGQKDVSQDLLLPFLPYTLSDAKFKRSGPFPHSTWQTAHLKSHGHGPSVPPYFLAICDPDWCGWRKET